MLFICSSLPAGEVSSVSSLGEYRSGPLVLEDAGLCTDLYELTMAASYLREGMTAPATFSLFVRKLPSERAFLLAAGLEDTLHYLEHFRFSPRAIQRLRELGRFESDLAGTQVHNHHLFTIVSDRSGDRCSRDRPGGSRAQRARLYDERRVDDRC